MMRPDAKVEKVYLYPKPVDFRNPIDGLAALVELDIKVAVFDPVLFRLPQQAQEPDEDLVQGAQRLLSLTQTPGIGTIQNIARCDGRSDYPQRPGTELAARRFRPLAQPSSSGFDAVLRSVTRYNPGHDFSTDDLPDDPVLHKQLLFEALSRQEESAQAYQTHIVDLKGSRKRSGAQYRGSNASLECRDHGSFTMDTTSRGDSSFES